MEVRVGGVIREADGSAELKVGLTQVVAAVVGPVERPRGCDLLTVNISVAPFAFLDRKVMRRNDRRAATAALALKGILSGVIAADRYESSYIKIDVTVIALDGNLLAPVINCAMLAVVDAGISLKEMVSAVDVGLVDNHVLVDLAQRELVGTPTVSVACTSRHNKLASLMMYNRVPEDALAQLVSTSQKACARLHQAFYEAVRRRAADGLELA
ncbi:MAG: hypothetical protein KVP17_003529 [Porospora cf. gigantea B]|uniref:uncharacterized protein n=1 Tax=Porospora cf. gigantea B TaxID=2853592 RepID=UPI003571F8D6|nr:MAG: hypothetical protein KVP17_003529 [Porospora cf. gigantea B]